MPWLLKFGPAHLQHLGDVTQTYWVRIFILMKSLLICEKYCFMGYLRSANLSISWENLSKVTISNMTIHLLTSSGYLLNFWCSCSYNSLLSSYCCLLVSLIYFLFSLVNIARFFPQSKAKQNQTFWLYRPSLIFIFCFTSFCFFFDYFSSFFGLMLFIL